MMTMMMILMNLDYDFFRTLNPIPFYRDDGDDFDDDQNNVEDVMMMVMMLMNQD